MERVWLNGAILPRDQARIDPADRGFLLGDGVFETIAVCGGEICHLPAHLARLAQGAGVLGITADLTPVPAAARALLIANGLRPGDSGNTKAGRDAVLRLTLTRGRGARGVLPQGVGEATLLITAQPLRTPLREAGTAARVITARQTARNEKSPLSRIKSLAYGDSILARQEAAAAGADDALLCNSEGALAEASAANLLLCLNGTWLTPPVEDGALPGIGRALALEARLVAPGRITPADLAHAEAGLLMNSLSLRPLAAIDGRVLRPPPASLIASLLAVLFPG